VSKLWFLEMFMNKPQLAKNTLFKAETTTTVALNPGSATTLN